MKLLIIGHGFVGQAVDYGFSAPHVEKTIIDPKYGSSLDQVNVLAYDAIFVCVPTPMGKDGTVDASIVKLVMHQLREVNLTPIILKSTVPPDIIKMFGARNNFVYNPEFLTEKSANEQFVDPQFHIFGGDRKFTKQVQYLYENYSLCNIVHCMHMTAEEASFVKYAINTFLATKVTFFNQLYDVVKDTDANFATIIKAVGMDKRIGPSHTKVPGFDGKQGFGGACFPKDTSAFVEYDNRLTLLEKVITINNGYRSKYSLNEREKEQHVSYEQTQKEQ